MNAYPIDISVKPEVEAFFDPATNTISYVVKDPASNACAIVDSVMDIDYAAGRITYSHADQIIAHVRGHAVVVRGLAQRPFHPLPRVRAVAQCVDGPGEVLLDGPHRPLQRRFPGQPLKRRQQRRQQLQRRAAA